MVRALGFVMRAFVMFRALSLSSVMVRVLEVVIVRALELVIVRALELVMVRALELVMVGFGALEPCDG